MDNSDLTIDGSTAIWKIPNLQGDLGGTYTGSFVFRCYLDPLSQIQAGKEYRSLLGDQFMQAHPAESDLAFALTQLKQRILSSPPFWSSTLQTSGMPGNVGDLNVIAAVLNAAMRAESLFKDKVQKERDDVLEATIAKGEQLLEKQQKGEE